MTPERARDVERICQAALERGVDDRAGFLAEACGDDGDLRSQVDRLLAQESAAGSDAGSYCVEGHGGGGRNKTPARTIPNRSPSPTELLQAWGRGDSQALDQLLPLVHGELRRLARGYMARERPGHTLQASALVNEAYLRLIELKRIRWQDRTHFFAMSARLMRRILVDFARARRNDKRGGGAARVTLDDALVVSKARGQDLIALDDALVALAAVHPRKSEVVELRFFGGLSLEETAEALHMSIDTVKRDWRFAKLWLLNELEGES